MKNKYTLPKIENKKRININEFKKLAKKIKNYLEEEDKIKNNEYNSPSRIIFSN